MPRPYGPNNDDRQPVSAEAASDEFAEAREQRYPAIVRFWRSHWEELTPFLAFPPEVRHTLGGRPRPRPCLAGEDLWRLLRRSPGVGVLS
ncbi:MULTISPECIES: transposase [Prauserella salsuginis group]|uniref:Transposase n=1 Tax=Prauserella salsuginis TaxID=387889 RepID=A0ABW6FX82_9PSEU